MNGSRQSAVVMEKINSYRDLRVWQEALNLAETIYAVTAKFPREELYGLTSQIRRAAVSVPANIAEGYGRDNFGSYIQFLRIGQGSLKEIETHMILATRLKMADQSVEAEILSRFDSIGRMLRALIRSLQGPGASDAKRLPTAEDRLPARASSQ